MLASKPLKICDPYEWLPSHGETKVEFTAKGLTLEAEVFYELAMGSEGKKKLVFDGVCSFAVSAAPGVEITRIEYEGLDASGCLVEFDDSEAARMWDQHFSWEKKTIRHFQIWFLSANEQLVVFAEKYRLVEG